ncbi:MAG: hypothetical protein IT324_08045 [Anaerolineae bacterium]|nr:hypothetical protein [Anaerolineae bacterium]
MLRKGLLIVLVTVLIGVLAIGGLATTPAHAQNPTGDFPLTVEMTGVIQSMTPNQIVLTDGTPIFLSPSSIIPATLQIGQTIIVSAQIENNQLIANIISIIVATPTPIVLSPIPFTPTAVVIVITATPTAIPPTAQHPAPAVTVTPTTACNDNSGRPVATRLAAAFQVSVDEINGWHCQGFGFGEIARAYMLAGLSGQNGQPAVTVNEIFAARKAGQGWGNIVKAVGVDPNRLAPGLVIRFRGSTDDNVEFSDSKGNKVNVDTSKGKKDKNNNDDNGNNGKGNKGNKDDGNNGKGNDKKDKDNGKGNNGNGKGNGNKK